MRNTHIETGITLLLIAVLVIGWGGVVQGAEVEGDPVYEKFVRGYMLTEGSAIGLPLYQGHTPGAIHMMTQKAADGYYYAYDGDPTDWTVNQSTNGIEWRRRISNGYPLGTWGKLNFWAPEVIEYDGKYLMFYCSREIAEIPSSRIGLAISGSPKGPFVDIGRPLFAGTESAEWHVIDPNPFIDPDTGKKYLYFSKDGYTHWNEDLQKDIPESRIYGVELAEDMMSIVGEPQLLLHPSQAWEYKSHLLDGKRLWNEAPTMLKVGDVYYLMYSANLFLTGHYAVGYATSKSPLGPFEKYELNPVISSTAATEKAGHNSVIISPDGSEYFTSYTLLNQGRWSSRIGFRADGSMYVNGPTRGYQAMPSGSSWHVNHAADAQVTTSSTRSPYRARAINDGEIGVYERFERYEWMSDDEKEGAWIELRWDEPRSVEFILLYTSAVPARKVSEGRIVLNDDPRQTILGVRIPSGPGEPAVIHFPSQMPIRSIRFSVDRLLAEDGTAGMSEIVALGYRPEDEGLIPVTESRVGRQLRGEGFRPFWIASPARGAILNGTTPILVETLSPTYQSVRFEVDGRRVYEGPVSPADLMLDPAELEVGSHQLAVSLVDSDGVTHRQNLEFLVEHARLLGLESGGRIMGSVPLRTNLKVSRDSIESAVVTLVPVSDSPDPVGREVLSVSGPSLPDTWELDTLAFDDGAYDVVFEVKTNAGVGSVSTQRVVIRNWETLEDPLFAPISSGWFGVVDRLRTTDRSEGWEFVGNDSDLLFGDADRIRRRERTEEFLTWTMRRVHDFAFTAYVPSSATNWETGLQLEVSADGISWVGVPHTVRIVDRAHSGWTKVAVQGIVPTGVEAVHVRLTFRAGEEAHNIQLGHVVLRALIEPDGVR